MGGRVVVMKPSEYEQWLRTGAPEESLVAAGGRLFQQLGCSGCHSQNSIARAPLLDGVYGKPVAAPERPGGPRRRELHS